MPSLSYFGKFVNIVPNSVLKISFSATTVSPFFICIFIFSGLCTFCFVVSIHTFSGFIIVATVESSVFSNTIVTLFASVMLAVTLSPIIVPIIISFVSLSLVNSIVFIPFAIK